MTIQAIKRQFSINKFQQFISSEKIIAIKFFLKEMLSPLFVTEWGKRASLGAVILSAVLLLEALIQISLSWHADWSIAHASSLPAQAVANHTEESIQAIPNEHLFGDAGISSQGYVPITSLQLHLVGIISGAEENSSRVIISEENKPGKIYSIGDSMSSGIRVYGIVGDGVILDNAGHLEKLPLQRASLHFGEMPKGIENLGANNEN